MSYQLINEHDDDDDDDVGAKQLNKNNGYNIRVQIKLIQLYCMTWLCLFTVIALSADFYFTSVLKMALHFSAGKDINQQIFTDDN